MIHAKRSASYSDGSLLGSAGDDDVRSKHRQSFGGRVPDAGVAARDHRHLSAHVGRS